MANLHGNYPPILCSSPIQTLFFLLTPLLHNPSKNGLSCLLSHLCASGGVAAVQRKRWQLTSKTSCVCLCGVCSGRRSCWFMSQCRVSEAFWDGTGGFNSSHLNLSYAPASPFRLGRWGFFFCWSLKLFLKKKRREAVGMVYLNAVPLCACMNAQKPHQMSR